jgi:hypothetical protein
LFGAGGFVEHGFCIEFIAGDSMIAQARGKRSVQMRRSPMVLDRNSQGRHNAGMVAKAVTATSRTWRCARAVRKFNGDAAKPMVGLRSGSGDGAAAGMKDGQNFGVS